MYVTKCLPAYISESWHTAEVVRMTAAATTRSEDEWTVVAIVRAVRGKAMWSSLSASRQRMRYIHTRLFSGIWSRLYGSFPSALNTWSKVWPWILIWAYLIWNFAPIFGQQISILDPPPAYIGLFGPSWSELPPYGWIGRVEDRLGLGHISVTDGQKLWLLKLRLLAGMCEKRD